MNHHVNNNPTPLEATMMIDNDTTTMDPDLVPVRLPSPLVTPDDFERAVAAKLADIGARREALGALQDEARELAVAGKPTATTRSLIRSTEDDLVDLDAQLDALREGLAAAVAAVERDELDADVRAYYASSSAILAARADVLAAREALDAREAALAVVVKAQAEELLPGRGIDDVRTFRVSMREQLTARGATIEDPAGVLCDGGDSPTEVRAESVRFAALSGEDR